MAQLPQPFNAQQFDPSQSGGFSQLPKGLHPVKIIASEIKANNAGDGGDIIYELEAIDGPAMGRHHTMKVPVYSAGDKARAFGEARQSAICHVTGVFLVSDTAALHNIPFVVDVEEQALTSQQLEKQSKGESVSPFTQIKRILDINCNEPKAGGQAQPAQAPAQAPAAAPAPAAGGWGGQPPAQAPAAAPAAAWGGSAPAAQAPAPAPAAAPAAAGWNQQAPAAGGSPAWGKR